MKYRVLDEVQIVGVTQKDTTTFVSVINTILRELVILIVQFEDINLWDAGFLMEKGKELPSRWCNVVIVIVTSVIANKVLPPSLEDMFKTLTPLTDALFRELRVGGDDALATMTKESNKGTLEICKKPARKKVKCGEGGALLDKSTVKPQLEVGGGLQTPRRRDALRTALVVELSPAATTTQLKTKGKKLSSGGSGRQAEEEATLSLAATIALSTPRRQTREAGRANSRVVSKVPARTFSTSLTTASAAAARKATTVAAAFVSRSTKRAAHCKVQTAVAPPQRSGRILGMKVKAMKRKGAQKRDSKHCDHIDALADVEGATGNDSGEDAHRSGMPTVDVHDSGAAVSSPQAPSRRTASPMANAEPSPVRETAMRLTTRRLPLVRKRYDGSWTSYPLAQLYDVAKEKVEITCTVYKQPPLKGDRDKKSYMDLRMAHNMEFKTKVEYMYLFGYEQHFQLPLERMRPVNQETEGLMVYRKLEKDGISIMYDKMSSLHYQKQVFTVMPDTRRRPRSWGEICDDVQFIIINGQHTWAAAKEVLGRATVPDPQLVDMMRMWECKVVWTTNHNHLHSLSYLCNDSNSGGAICSSTSSAIMHCRALWEDAGKPLQVRKNAARGGAHNADGAASKKWEAFKDKAMQALIATLNPSVRRKFFDFDSRGERYLMMTSDKVWKKWESIFKLHQLGNLKDVITGKPLRLALDWEYKPIGSSVREVSGLTNGEIGELASRILESPAKVYLQPPPKDSKKRAKVHRAQSVKEWCVRKKQKKVVLREVQRRVNQVRGENNYFPLNFNLYDMNSNAVQYGNWEFVKSKYGLTSHHMDYLLRSAGNSFFVEQNKRPSFIIQRSHLFTKAIDQVLVTRVRTLYLESVLGFTIEYLYGEKSYSDKMMEYNHITDRRISADPSYKKSKVAISDIEVGCIIMDCRNFPNHPNEQIDSLTEKTFLAGLEAVGDANMTNLHALLCITVKHRADIMKRMLERYFDSDVQFEAFEYEPVGGEQRPLSKAAEYQILVLVMTTARGRAACDLEEDAFQVNLLHQGVEPSDYKQAQYRIEHRHCEFVGELRMELYLRYIDRFCKGDQAVLLMHAGTKAIRASRMLGRVCVLLHDLQSSTKQVIFGKAFMEGLTMIPRAFFYSSSSPLKTKLPKFHLKIASNEKVAIRSDLPSESESSGNQGSVESKLSSVKTFPKASIEVNTGEHTEEVLQQMASVREGSEDDGPESQDLRSEETTDDNAMQTGRDEEGAELEASEDGAREEESCKDHFKTKDSENCTPKPMSQTPCTGATFVAPGAMPMPYSSQVGSESHSQEEWGVLGHTAAAESLHQQSPRVLLPTQGGRFFPLLYMKSHGVPGRRFNFDCGGLNVGPASDVATLGADGHGGIAPAIGQAVAMGSAECIPATPKPQIVGLDRKVANDAYLFNLLEQGSPPEASVSIDAVTRQLAEHKRANDELLQRNVVMKGRLASRREPSFIDLDKVDDDSMEESMAELFALGQELRGQLFVKVEPANPLLHLSGSTAGAIPPSLQGCSQVAGLESNVDVKPAVAEVWRRTLAEGSSARNRKRKIDALVKNEAWLLKIMTDTERQHQEMMNKFQDLQNEVANLRKFAPSTGPFDSFPPDQQLQLLLGISSGPTHRPRQESYGSSPAAGSLEGNTRQSSG